MSYRIMVRSFEGWSFNGTSAGSYWERREVWSTWSAGYSYGEALSAQSNLQAGGIRAAIVLEDAYADFCASHTIC